jgi:glycine dehydrogenase subunit 1
MTRYTSMTGRDREEMLATIGVPSLEELFADIPEGVRLQRPLDLPPGKPEVEVYDELAALAARNVSTEGEITFLGAGMYDHYVPALVDAIVQRSEFLTPYTPYQPEISQGGLQVMFEFQTAISELTGLPVSNASLYEACLWTAARRIPMRSPLRSTTTPPPSSSSSRTSSARWRTSRRSSLRPSAPAPS